MLTEVDRERRGARKTLSVVAIVRDEERNLLAFLESHGFADEIVLVDSGSTDRSREIAAADPKVVWVHRAWTGFPQQWNHAIDHATGEWVLLSEADQRVSEPLRLEIAAVLGSNPSESAFLVPRRNYIFGRWLRRGGCYPDYCYPRLFRRGKGRFDESKPIHEKLQASGRVGRLRGHFDHFSTASVERYLAKLNTYTDAEAQYFVQLRHRHGSRPRAALAILRGAGVPWRQKLSYLRPLAPGWPLLTFVWHYVFRLGFLDGRAGFRYWVLSSFYEFVWRAKVEDLLGRR